MTLLHPPLPHQGHPGSRRSRVHPKPRTQGRDLCRCRRRAARPSGPPHPRQQTSIRGRSHHKGGRAKGSGQRAECVGGCEDGGTGAGVQPQHGVPDSAGGDGRGGCYSRSGSSTCRLAGWASRRTFYFGVPGMAPSCRHGNLSVLGHTWVVHNGTDPLGNVGMVSCCCSIISDLLQLMSAPSSQCQHPLCATSRMPDGHACMCSLL